LLLPQNDGEPVQESSTATKSLPGPTKSRYKPEVSEMSLLGKVYPQVGRLVLSGMPAENFIQPFPGINLDGGTPLLIHGKWENVVLV
jgi:hypothetical protein